MQQAAFRAPVEFITGWLQETSLPPYGLAHRPGEPGLDVVIRALLWNYVEKSEAQMDRIAQAFPDSAADEAPPQTDAEAFKNCLVRLGDFCPALAYGLASRKLRGDKYKRYVKGVAASMLHQSDSADAQQLRNHLGAASREAADLIGIAPANLEAGAAAFASHLGNPASGYSQFEPALRGLERLLAVASS